VKNDVDPVERGSIASRFRMSAWMNSALGFTQGGFPRRCVCGSRLSNARTCKLRAREIDNVRADRPAAPVRVRVSFHSFCHSALAAASAATTISFAYEAREKLPSVRRDILPPVVSQVFRCTNGAASRRHRRLSGRQKFDFESDLDCALYRLVEARVRAPINLLEQCWCGFFTPIK